ncbi:MAG TPA: glycosyltransferase 87 family protein, partial [Solirubrobacteraceae bacterium]|nr:glycosyltransferase 87 family protein [Solirubrobacteraceae bacterium]
MTVAAASGPGRPGRTWRTVRRRGTTWIGPAALAGIATLGAWLAVGAAAGSTIVDTGSSEEPDWVAGPLAGLGSDLTVNRFGWALLAMTLAYALAVRCSGDLPLRWVMGTVILVHLAFALAPPILSSDVFHYLAYAREGFLHGRNPYLSPPISIAPDPIVSLVYWQHLTSPYGPLFTLLSYPLGALEHTDELWTIKAFTASASLTGVALLARAASRSGRSSSRAATVVGLNPLLLVYGVGGAHNDLLVMATVCGGVLAVSGPRDPAAGSPMGSEGRSVAAGALAVVAGGLKASGAVAAPFLILGAERPRRALVAALVAGLAVVAVTLPIFGPHVLDTLGVQASSGSTLARYSGPDVLGSVLGTAIARLVLDVLVAGAAL